MTQEQHPITPPPELFKQWFKQWEDDILNERDSVDHVLDRAWRDGFQAGADQELEACCEWISFTLGRITAANLRAARRPEPSSLKEQALTQTNAILNDPNRALLMEVRETLELNRRALEALPDD